MQLQVLDGAGQAGTPLEVADSAFGAAFREPLVHQVVVAYMAGGRAGTKAQKTRSEVRGGGAKPWRQKGTGRARAGTIRSPVWRGGGRAFAARPRDFTQKVNRKSYRAAMRSILSELARQETLTVVDSIALDEPRTKALLAKLQALGLSDVLLVTEDVSPELYLASRNLPEVDVRDVHGLDPVSLLRHQRVLMTAGAVRKIEEWLA